ncbi:redoxin domain-containing protein [bacterium]|nr:MAG: redoxin domain-containing protein [bacterium]
MVELQQRLSDFQALGARIVGVSVDPIATSQSLSTQLKLGYQLLEDTDHRVGSAFGIFRLPSAGMDMGPVDDHSIFLLDSAGRVIWKELAPQTMHVPVSDVLAALRSK